MNVPKIRFKEFTDEWSFNRLENISSIIMGQSPNSENYTNNSTDTILIQGNADLDKGHIAPRIYTTQITKECKIDDIIMTVRAPVGDVAITEYNACIGRGVCAIKGSKYIYHYLNYLKSKDYWKKISKGSTIDSITSNDIKQLIISSPNSKLEINKIIKTLNLLDKKIELQLQKVEALKLYKMCIISTLFKEAKDRTKLKNICDCKSSSLSIEQLEFDEGKYKLYGANGLVKSISNYLFEQEYIGIIKDGASVGKTMICDKESSVLGTLNALFPINVDINYLNIIINRINFKKYIVGSGIPHIYFKDYKNESLLIHSKDLQEKIGLLIKEYNNKILLEKNKLNMIILLKKGLVQSMFV